METTDMEIAFENLIYESDESISSKGSSKSGHFKRRTTRASMIKSECMPTRRSGRLQMRQQSGDDDKDKSMNISDDIPPPTRSRAKGKNAKISTLDDRVEKVLGATTIDGQLKLCILLKGDAKPKLVTSDEAKQKYPYRVLDFYESCLVWETDDDETTDGDVDNDDDDDDEDDEDDQVLATFKSKA